MKPLQKLVAVFKGEEGIVEVDLGDPWEATHDNVFDTGLRGRSHGNGIAIASKPRRNPKNVNLRDGRSWLVRACWHRPPAQTRPTEEMGQHYLPPEYRLRQGGIAEQKCLHFSAIAHQKTQREAEFKPNVSLRREINQFGRTLNLDERESVKLHFGG